MTMLSFSLASALLPVLHGVLNLNIKLHTFVVNGLIKGEIEKLNGQYNSLICDESLTCRGLNLNPEHFDNFTFIFFVLRITFTCLVV
jgi:hypothetical protein